MVCKSMYIMYYRNSFTEPERESEIERYIHMDK